MERVKNEVMEEGKQRFKKIGGGSLRIGKRIIKPGQEFDALPSEISPAFRNMVIPVGGTVNWKDAKLAPAPVPTPKEVVPLAYTIQPHGKSALWYDVVDGQGKVLNEKSLKKEVAEKLLADLLK